MPPRRRSEPDEDFERGDELDQDEELEQKLTTVDTPDADDEDDPDDGDARYDDEEPLYEPEENGR